MEVLFMSFMHGRKLSTVGFIQQLQCEVLYNQHFHKSKLLRESKVSYFSSDMAKIKKLRKGIKSLFENTSAVD